MVIIGDWLQINRKDGGTVDVSIKGAATWGLFVRLRRFRKAEVR